MAKYNLGCGTDKRAGYVNVDKCEIFTPDKIIDLEKFPWDIKTNSADEIILHHVLEHIGETSECFLNIMKELYRISKPFAKIHISVPHPYSYNFIIDPTHVRKITEEIFYMFSKNFCDKLVEEKKSITKLAYICNVDFDITQVTYKLNKAVCDYLSSKNLISLNAIESFEDNLYHKIFMNTVDEIYIQITAKKEFNYK